MSSATSPQKLQTCTSYSAARTTEPPYFSIIFNTYQSMIIYFRSLALVSSAQQYDLLVLLMSVLLIGEGQLGNYYSPYFSTQQQEVSLARRERRAKQQQYRLALFEQIRQKQDQRHLHRYHDNSLSRRKQTLLPQKPSFSLPQPQYRQSLPYHQQEQPEQQSFQNPFQTLKRRQLELQSHYPYAYSKEKQQQTSQTPFQKFRKERLERLKTENTYEQNRLDSIEVDLTKKRQEIYDYGNHRLGQSYDNMQDYRRRIHTDNNPYSPFPMSISKHKRCLDTPAYSYPNHNPQQDKDFTRLPSISKLKGHREERREGSEEQWKEWFAKQKLRELESYYHKLATSGSNTPPLDERFPMPFLPRR